MKYFDKFCNLTDFCLGQQYLCLEQNLNDVDCLNGLTEFQCRARGQKEIFHNSTSLATDIHDLPCVPHSPSLPQDKVIDRARWVGPDTLVRIMSRGTTGC